jgi:hypothetical protein
LVRHGDGGIEEFVIVSLKALIPQEGLYGSHGRGGDGNGGSSSGRSWEVVSWSILELGLGLVECSAAHRESGPKGGDPNFSKALQRAAVPSASGKAHKGVRE